jgi:hypothetical protein
VPELRVQLDTLLGLNGEPGEVPGWGYLPAWLARHLVARMHGAEWRYAVCDTGGFVIGGGLIRARPITPHGGPVRRDARRGGIVEIALRAGDPARPMAGSPVHDISASAAWAPVLAELAHAAAGPAGARRPHTRDANPRTAGAVLRRWIQQRDRRCVHPCCRVPASKADQDHRLGYALGGPTTEANLSAPCRHDHRLKDQGHWQLTAPRPGLTIWTSPLGRQYQSRPPPAIPPPITTRLRPSPWEPPTSASAPQTCDCMQVPCPHDQADATEPADPGVSKDGQQDRAAPEPDILDDGEPPF